MQRLQTRAQFQSVLSGSTLSRTSHFALHSLPLMQSIELGANDEAQATDPQPLFPQHTQWVGAMVPKRWAKRAVTRNTIKRQIYNACLASEQALPVAAYVVRLRSGFDRKQFVSATSDALKQAVRTELLLLLSRVCARRSPGATASKPALES